jgi:predicted RNA polymerase sigma factor
LNQRTRKAIELHELGELSTEETARALGVSIGAVKGRVFHGRRKLRKSLEEYVGSAWTSRRDTSRAIKTRHSRENSLFAARAVKGG